MSSPINVSSGLTAKATTSAAAVELIPATPGVRFTRIRIFNKGAVDGFFNWDGEDGDTHWHFCPAGSIPEEHAVVMENTALRFKRAGVTDCTGLYASAWDDEG